MGRLLIISLLLTFSTTAFAQFKGVANAASQNKLALRYMEYIESKGYNPEIDKDGDILFYYKEKRYYCTLDPNDEKFFRIARIGNLSLDNQTEIDRAKIISHDLTKDIKVAKVYWTNGQLWASSEQLLADADDYKNIFDRTLKLTSDIYDKFVKAWNDN